MALFPCILKQGEEMLHEYREEIAHLRANDKHFAKIFEEHNALDEKIKNMEQGIEVATGVVIDELKKEKLKLKDEIYSMILKYKNA